MELKLLNLDIVVNSGIRVPELIDHSKVGLFPDHTYSQGLITRTDYYGSYENPVYSDLYIRESIIYTIADDLYTQRVITIDYYDPADLVAYQTTRTEYFNKQQSFEIEHLKRENILADGKAYLITVISQPDYYDLIETCAVNIALYTEGPFLPLTDQITALVGVKPYLTGPIGTALNAILSDI